MPTSSGSSTAPTKRVTADLPAPARRAVLAPARRTALAAALLAPLFGLAACLRPPSRPVQALIPQLRFDGRPGAPGSGTRVVMLPGVASPPEEFVQAGFPAALAAVAPGAEVRVLDSHFGYFEEGRIFTRLRDEVVLPARQEGVQRLWLVGISLGGFGALGHIATRPGEVDGVLALAPYLGTAGLQREIESAGGPRRWAETPDPPDLDRSAALGRRVWRHLATQTGETPVHLGFGTRDRFVNAHRLAATLLPADQVQTAPGGHDWPVWSALWQAWLARHGQLLLGGAGPARPAARS